MKLSKIEQVNEFLAIVDSCKGDVTLRSVDGDIFNLKSKLSQYIAIAALLGQPVSYTHLTLPTTERV